MEILENWYLGGLIEKGVNNVHIWEKSLNLNYAKFGNLEIQKNWKIFKLLKN